MDASEEVLVEEILARRGVPYAARNAQIGACRGRMIFTSHGPVRITLFNSASTRGRWVHGEEVAAFFAALELFLARNRPGLVWTYGGDPVALVVQRLVKQFGIPILFALHNFNYQDPAVFRMVDHVIVPSEFSRLHYRRSLGLECHRLPYVIDPRRISPHPGPLPEGEGDRIALTLTLSRRERGSFVTFVNPQATKGLYFVARLAEVLARRRPEIPLLVVEGRNTPGWKQETGIDLAQLPNLTIRPNTVDPRGFYAETKLLVVPSAVSPISPARHSSRGELVNMTDADRGHILCNLLLPGRQSNSAPWHDDGNPGGLIGRLAQFRTPNTPFGWCAIFLSGGFVGFFASRGAKLIELTFLPGLHLALPRSVVILMDSRVGSRKLA